MLKAKDRPALSAADGSIVYLLAIAASLTLQFIFSLFGVSASDPNYAAVNFVFMGCLQLGFFAVPLVCLSRRGRRLIIGFRPLKWYNYLLSVAAAGIVLGGFILLASWFEALLTVMGYTFADPLPFSGAAAITLGILVTVCMAPVFEELIFRGALLSGLIQRERVLPAVLLSGLAFSLMHINPEQTVYQLALGCAAGYLALKADSLWPAVLLHAASNGIAVVFSLMPEGEPAGSLMLQNPGLFIPLSVFFAAAAAGLIHVIGRAMAGSEKRDLKGELTRRYTGDNAEALLKFRDQTNVMGQNTHRIVYGIALGLCAAVWLFVFILRLFFI
ncbi:MAG: CPBP family intramembrane metalloprotease [Clostridiales bacterium]|jgi:membrane protease YdiL (CAAX protease family)|nr:CPBP family intramembrane metalloprotease [Clostridiales bacterium]